MVRPTDDDDHGDVPRRDDDPTVRDAVERVDTTIGPYRLLERLGEGAMGEVWRAEQREPIRRIVALKIIKRGMDTREVVTRFEIERQAMALMDHPWIARVYDAGETERGRPYIAMEYVAGEKLTDYCARNRLSIEERLKLFQKVCQAIQHAHQKAVIHRDLKPSNVLVTEVDGEPVPKVIDFGIAKATAQRLTDRSAATFVGQLIGTPLYMSPEQVEMSAAGVDTRADVYSLGVILYELLSGTLPHDPQRLAGAAFDEVLKILREEEPARPSTRVSTLGDRTAEIAARAGLDGKKLVGKLRGDLDWITLKALEKDRKRRYESPKDVAEDIERYLTHQAIEARPPSPVYRASRFVRRHAAQTTVVAAFLVALVAFAVWQTVQSDRIAHERDRAMANERLSLGREQLSEDATLAMAYALSSLELMDQPGTRDLIRKAFAAGPLRDEWPRYDAPGNPITVDASHDGRLCAVAWSQSNNPTVGIYDVESLEMRLLTAPTDGIAYLVTFNADASHVASIGDDGVHVWRVSDGLHLWHLSDESVEDAHWLRILDPTKLRLATYGIDDPVTLREIDLRTGVIQVLGRTAGRHHDVVEHHSMSMTPDGEWVLDFDRNRVLLQRMDTLESVAFREVGRHEAPVSAVALDRFARVAASVDVEGRVRVWDLSVDPSRMLAEYTQEPGTYQLGFDPFRPRFFTSWGSDRLRMFEPLAPPLRKPVEMRDRTHWTHDGTFLPSGDVITGANGRSPARWHTNTPVAWSFAQPDTLGSGDANFVLDAEGRWMYMWARAGHVLAIPIVEGSNEAVRFLARTPAWNAGSNNEFFVSADGKRAVTYTGSEAGARIIDLETGAMDMLPASSQPRVLYGVSPSARTACIMTYTDDGTQVVADIVDLDSRSSRASFVTGPTVYRGIVFDGDDALVGVATDHVVRFEFAGSDARADTLWRGDARGGGFALDGGRSAVVRDSQMRLRWIDLVDGREVVLGSTPRQGLSTAALDPSGRLLAVGGWWDSVLVFDLRSGRQWSLPARGDTGRRMTYATTFDPLGRWLIAQHEGELVGWNLPLDEVFSDPTYEVLLERVRGLTNVRVVPSDEESLGFRLTNTSDR